MTSSPADVDVNIVTQLGLQSAVNVKYGTTNQKYNCRQKNKHLQGGTYKTIHRQLRNLIGWFESTLIREL